MPFGKETLNDGNEIPTIAFGTGSVNKYHDVSQYVVQALEAGFRHIDTAQFYANEESVQKALAQTGLKREDVYITTKYSGGDVQKSFRDSLRKIGTSYVDLYLIHHPSVLGDKDIRDVWKEFEQIKEAGLARSIGVSNFTLPQLSYLFSIATVKPSVNQIQFNPYTLATHSSLLDFTKKNGIIIEAYSPLASLTRYPGGPVDVPVKRAVEKRNLRSEKSGVTEAQILLRWARQKGAVVVTTTSKKDRDFEYLDAGDIDELSEEEVKEIDLAGAQGPPPALSSMALAGSDLDFVTRFEGEVTHANREKDASDGIPFGTIPLNDGTRIPAIAFGTGSEHFGKDATEYVGQALESGFVHLDTAQVYNNEESVGQAIRESGLAQEEIYVTTKFYQGEIPTVARESLQKLGLKSVDLYLIHFPTSVPNIEAAWKEMEQLQEEGLAKSIGVSNYNLEELQRVVKAAKVKPAVNQIRLHPYNYAENKALIDYATKHGIVIEAYSSLTPITKSPGGALSRLLASLADKRNATPAQVIFAWVRAKGAVVVTTSSRKERLQEYLGTADIEPLTKEEIEEIDRVGARGPPSLHQRILSTRDKKRLIFVVFMLMLIGMFKAGRYGCHGIGM